MDAPRGRRVVEPLIALVDEVWPEGTFYRAHITLDGRFAEGLSRRPDRAIAFAMRALAEKLIKET